MATYKLTMKSERDSDFTEKRTYTNKDDVIDYLLEFVEMMSNYMPKLEVK